MKLYALIIAKIREGPISGLVPGNLTCGCQGGGAAGVVSPIHVMTQPTSPKGTLSHAIFILTIDKRRILKTSCPPSQHRPDNITTKSHPSTDSTNLKKQLNKIILLHGCKFSRCRIVAVMTPLQN